MVLKAIKSQSVNERLDDHETRLQSLESIAEDIGNISDTVDKIFKYIKIAAPSIISAAIAAGIVNGKLGAFLNALFQ